MPHSDPISDFLTRIRNASGARHKYVDVNRSGMNLAIIELLKDRGYIAHYLLHDTLPMIRVFLKYLKSTHQPVIRGIKRISTPGLRCYVGYRRIPKVFSGLGLAILSTSLGVVAGDQARLKKAGGELLCLVW